MGMSFASANAASVRIGGFKRSNTTVERRAIKTSAVFRLRQFCANWLELGEFDYHYDMSDGLECINDRSPSQVCGHAWKGPGAFDPRGVDLNRLNRRQREDCMHGRLRKIRRDAAFETLIYSVIGIFIN